MAKNIRITLILLASVILGCAEEISDSLSSAERITSTIGTVPKEHSDSTHNINPTEPQSVGSIPNMRATTLPIESVTTPSPTQLPTPTQIPTPTQLPIEAKILEVTSQQSIVTNEIDQSIPVKSSISSIPETVEITPTIQPSPIPTKIATTFVSQVTTNQDNLVLSNLNLTRTSIGVSKAADILRFSIKNNNSSTVAAGISIYKRLGNQSLIVPNHEYSHLVILDPEETQQVTVLEYYPAGESYLQDSSLYVETYMVSNFGLFGSFSNCDEIKPFFNSVATTEPECID